MEKSNVNKKKIVVSFSIVFLIASIFGGLIGFSIAGSSWTPPNIGLGDFPSTANYVIKADTSTTPTTYYGVASNGTIMFTSSNCSDVVRQANAQLSSNPTGGGIVLASGQTFSLTAPIVIGEPTYTIPITLSSDGTAKVNYTTVGLSFDLIQTYYYLTSASSAHKGITIKGINVDGTGGMGNGIVLQAFYSTIEDTNVINCGKSGILLTGGNSPGAADNTLHNVRCYSNNCGLNMSQAASDVQVSESRFFFNTLDGVYQGAGDLFLQTSSIYLNGRYAVYIQTSAWAEISGNWIGQDEKAEINIEGAANIWGTQIAITGNSFALPPGAPTSRDTTNTYPIIRMVGNSASFPLYGISITGNNFWDGGNFCNYAITTQYVNNITITGNSFSGIPLTKAYSRGTSSLNVVFDGTNTGLATTSTVTPTATNWATPPTNLANTVDDDYSTTTGTGNTKGGAAWSDLGELVWNFGTPVTVTVNAQVGTWSNLTSGVIHAYWQTSTDGINYYSVASGSDAGYVNTWTAETQFTVNPQTVHTQYLRLQFQSSVANIDFNAKIYEVKILWLGP